MRSVILFTACGVLALGPVADAAASDRDIPAFARRYRVSCNLCHEPIPTLTAFGENFAGNGFRFAAEEPPRDTIATGDALLDLPARLPLAIRFDAYFQTFTDGETATDFELPYNMKVLSGGTLSQTISYYFYFFLFERGEVGGVEDAFIYFNDIADQPVDVAVGQFQVSDPLFKRELRLEFEDYAIYRAQLGAQPADLTYDRGIMAITDYAGFTFTGEIVNGNGKGEAEPNRRLDDDLFKNIFGHLTRQLIPELRVGVMGYRGRQKGALDEAGPLINNDLWMVGGDATISIGALEINGQYIHREDDTPTFTPGEPTVETDGGFAEAILRSPNGRWYGFGLYNLVDADRPLLDIGLGGPAQVSRYETLSGGIGYLLRRNVRLSAEATWDIEQETARWTAGLVTAF